MIPDLVTFIQRLELLGFFAGYSLLFTLVYLGFNIRSSRQMSGIYRLLPAGYALTAVFFLLRQAFFSHDPSIPSIIALRIWGYSAILFWLPVLQKRPVLSFVHSLVFFALLAFDLFTGLPTPSGRDQISNDMHVLTGSLVLNAASLVLVMGAGFIKSCMRRSFNRE